MTWTDIEVRPDEDYRSALWVFAELFGAIMQVDPAYLRWKGMKSDSTVESIEIPVRDFLVNLRETMQSEYDAFDRGAQPRMWDDDQYVAAREEWGDRVPDDVRSRFLSHLDRAAIHLDAENTRGGRE